MKTLISLEQYVKMQTKKSTENMKLGGVAEALHLINEYVRKLEQQPQLNRFIPCVEKDGKWVILEKPNKDNPKYQTEFPLEDYFDSMAYEVDCNKFESASKNVLFEFQEVKFNNCKDFKYQSETIHFLIKENTYIEYNCYHKNFDVYIDNEYRSSINSYSNLTKYNLPLTDNGEIYFNLKN